jgi:hypothetical protein
MAFPMGGEGEAGGEVLGFQFREVFEDLCSGSGVSFKHFLNPEPPIVRGQVSLLNIF